MTETQIALARHALGFDGRNKESYRNHFVCGPGSTDYNEWMAMVEQGEANRYPPREISGGMDTFSVKRHAALQVRKADEHLSRDFRE